jgi:hypothetical protein
MTTNDKLLTSIVGGDLIFVLTVFAVPWGNLKQEAETFSGGDLSWQLLQSKMKVISWPGKQCAIASTTSSACTDILSPSQ